MLHFVIGTKAQFIKMAPLMWLLQKEGRPYHLVDLSQHGALTASTLDDFGLTPSITRFGDATTLIKTYAGAAKWSLGVLAQAARPAARVRQCWFRDQAGYALVHGDTASTLLGTLLARRAGMPVALVEAGLTSGNLLNPFPEEAIRRLVQRMAAHCFCPGAKETAHLHSLALRAQIHDTGYNTGHDALFLALQQPVRAPATGDYSVATLHRLETLANGHSLRRAIAHIQALATRLGPVRFYLHPPTRNALLREQLLDALQATPGISLHELLPYVDFAQVLANARCIVTDGGSVQEEAASLGKRCLVLRAVTERDAGIGNTARLTGWNVEEDAAFLCATATAGTGVRDHRYAASRCVLDALLKDQPDRLENRPA